MKKPGRWLKDYRSSEKLCATCQVFLLITHDVLRTYSPQRIRIDNRNVILLHADKAAALKVAQRLVGAFTRRTDEAGQIALIQRQIDLNSLGTSCSVKLLTCSVE
jgi:lactam utilization protein B